MLPLSVAAGMSFLVPTTAEACSATPDVVDEVRVIEGPDCLSVDRTEDPGDYAHPTLFIENSCDDAVQVRINDCVPCYDTNDCFDCSEEWVELGTGDVRPRTLVFQLDFPVGDHLGETIESSIDWMQSDDSATLTLELDMPEKHPDQQANEACPGACNISATGGPGALAPLLLLLGAWGRRRRGA